jgi:ubiquinone biosynthesis protein COQ4
MTPFGYIQFAPLRALRAARNLIINPEDLPQVFTMIESLSGTTLSRITKRMAKEEGSARLLRERTDIVPTLVDRDALRRMPEGSLGRAYLAFVESENISAQGILDAAAQGTSHLGDLPPDLAYTHGRMRDTHDLWHALTGYKGDVLGELALIAFTYAQTKNPAMALMWGLGVIKLRGVPGSRQVMLEGYRRGKQAAWISGLRWEDLLPRPIDEVRKQLNMAGPPVYTPVRNSELNQPGMVAS